MKLLQKLLDIIFPYRCCHCGQLGSSLHADCLGRLPQALSTPAGNWIALLDYTHQSTKRLVRHLKNRRDGELVSLLATELHQRVIAELADEQLFVDWSQAIITSIPLHPRRLRRRGFNQAELLARAYATVSGSPYHNLLQKIRPTPKQALLGRTARLKNIRGSFSTKKSSLIKNQLVILIDDVITTGATTSEATRVLKSAGAKDVLVLSIAH